MSINSAYSELAQDTLYYQRLLQLLSIHPMVNGGYSWKIGVKGHMQEVRISSDGRRGEKDLGAKEISIIAIAFSAGDEKSQISRLLDQEHLMQHGIITTQDIIESIKSLIQMIRRDHLTNINIIQNAIENAAKICIVRSAYNKLSEHLTNNPNDLNDPEYIILLGYIIAILGYRYELRPYMINPKLEGTDWVEIYDNMFQSFSNENRTHYIESGYYALWEVFRSIRNDILQKKELKRLKIAKEAGSTQAKAFIEKVNNLISTPLPPSASSRPQDPRSPETP